MIWKILGIEQTNDRKKITAAYREKLALTNPEDHPEEFKQLRQAYENALAYADSYGKQEEASADPMELWKDKLTALYNDFQRRISPDAWKQLLSDEVCTSIDTRLQAEDILLTFFMDNYFISHEVWMYLNEQFHFVERRHQLSEKYPPAFVQNVLVDGSLYDDILPLKMFSPGLDGESCAAYLRLYNTIRAGKNDNIEELINQLKSLPETHPYGRSMIISYETSLDASMIEQQFALHKQYPEDIQIALNLLLDLHSQSRYKDEFAICEEMINLYPENIHLKYRYGEALAADEDYGKAIDQLNDIFRLYGGNQSFVYEIDQKRKAWAEKLTPALEEKLRNDPDNDKLKVDLAWAYLENYHDQQAQKLVSTIRKENVDPFDYSNLMGNTAVTAEEYDKAIEYFKEMAEIIKTLPEDGDARTRRNKARLGETYGRIGYLYYLTGEDDKSNEMYELALATAKNKLAILTQMCHISLKKHNYDRLLEQSEKLLDMDQSYAQGYLYKAYACFSRQMDGEAYKAINRSIELNVSELEAYILKGRILLVNRAYDDAKELIDFLLANGLQDTPGVLFLQGYYAEMKEKNDQAAFEFYNKAVEIIGDEPESYTFGAELFYRTLYLTGDRCNANDPDDRKKMLELADKGLKCHSEYYGLLDYKAWLLTKGQQYDEALKIYLHLAEDPIHSPKTDSQIGYIYYQDLRHNTDKALKYYQMALEKNGHYEAHFYIGMCLMYLNKLDEAEKHFLLLREKEPDELDSYYRMSTLNQMRGEYYEALYNINKTIDIDSKHTSPNAYYHYCKVQILRRLGKVNEAVAAAKELLAKFDAGYVYKLIFDILIQFGKYEQAQQYLKEWKKKHVQTEDRFGCEATLELLNNQLFRAKLSLANSGNLMNKERAGQLNIAIARNDARFAKEVALLKSELANTDDYSRVLGNLAYASYHNGDRIAQKKYAEDALVEIEKRLGEYRNNELLYMVRKARILALLGKGNEAVELLKQCEGHRLCAECPYNKCKDRYIFEAEVEEISGNEDKALQMAIDGHDIFPDEEDFVVMANMLRKKEKKK